MRKLLSSRKFQIIALFALIITVAIGSLSIARAYTNPINKTPDSNGVFAKYTGSGDGSSRSRYIDTKVLTWSSTSRGDVRRPTAAFSGTANGSTVAADSGRTLEVPVGGTVNFTNRSSAGSGSSLSIIDHQLQNSSGSGMRNGATGWMSSFKFDKPGTYFAYLNVYDNLDSKWTRGWDNYGNNGTGHKTVVQFDGVYGAYYFTKLQILVVEDKAGCVETHYLWSGGKWEIVKDRSHALDSGESLALSAISKYTKGDYKYLGYKKGYVPKPSGNYLASQSVTVRGETGKVIYVNFYYQETSSGGGSSGGDVGGDSGEIRVDFIHVVKRTNQVAKKAATRKYPKGSGTYYYAPPKVKNFTYDEEAEPDNSSDRASHMDAWDDGGRVKVKITSKAKEGYIYSVNCYYVNGDSGGDPDDNFPEPDPDPIIIPQPPTIYPDIALTLNIGTNGCVMNYMSMTGEIKGNADSIATVSEGSMPSRLTKHQTTVGINNFSEKAYSGLTKASSNTLTTNKVDYVRRLAKADLGSLFLGNATDPTVFDYYMTGRAEAELNVKLGEYPISKNVEHILQNQLPLTNETPGLTVTMTSVLDHYIDKNGNRVEFTTPKKITGNKFYRNMPITVEVVNDDPEKDPALLSFAFGEGAIAGQGGTYYQRILGIYHKKGDTSNNTVDMTHEMTGNIDLLQLKKEIDTVGKFKYEFTMPSFAPLGTYWYKAQNGDANSLPVLQLGITTTGTFELVPEPMAPTAIINEPTFAYEGDTVPFIQASTDPNGVDDIVKYEWTFPSGVTVTYNPGSTPGINGGNISFPPGTAGKTFKIKLKVTDSTGLTDTTEIEVKVVSQVPVANLEITGDTDEMGQDKDKNTRKENRKITISAANSVTSSKSPILWNECTWTVTPAGNGAKAEYIHIDTTNTNGNKQRTLQFEHPGKYRVTFKAMNSFLKANPNTKGKEAATTTFDINVYADKPPVVKVTIDSSKPDFNESGTECTVIFSAQAETLDGDPVKAPTGYSWAVYEDANGDGVFSESELLPASSYTIDSLHKSVSVKAKFVDGHRTNIKAIATAVETFGQPYVKELLNPDGSYIRKNSDYKTYRINWAPSIELIPDQGPDTTPPTEYNPNPGTPFGETDLDGDGLSDGKYIKAYTDDTFSIHTKIYDEFPEAATVSWKLEKLNHNDTYDEKDSSGRPWITSSVVSQTFNKEGGSMRIDSNGIYKLTATVIDDCGETATATIYIRIYPLPQAVLDTNPKYQIGGEWITKENIRFDLRSTPTIVDDEWGIAWHRMDWSKDNWDVIPLEKQSVDEIHFMDEFYKARYEDVFNNDNMFSGRNSPIGFGFQETTAIDIISMMGSYGEVDENNSYLINDKYRKDYYTWFDAMIKKLKEENPYCSIRVFKVDAYEDRMTPMYDSNIYGYFDGTIQGQYDEENRFLVDYTLDQFSTGRSLLTGDLAKMTEAGAVGGWIDVIHAGNVDVPDSIYNLPFIGPTKVFIEDILVAEGTRQEQLQKVVMLRREEGSNIWRLELPNGEFVKDKNGDTLELTDKIHIRVEFKDGPPDTAMLARGWAGEIIDKSCLVTYTKPIIETYNSIQGLRPGVPKYMLFTTNYIDTPEYSKRDENSELVTFDKNERYAELVAWLKTKDNLTLFNYGPAQHEEYYADQAEQLKDGDKYNSFYGFLSLQMYSYLSQVHDIINGALPHEVNNEYRSCSFTEPGLYDFKYWGTNYGGKQTVPVTYRITVIPDDPPLIFGEVNSPYFRDPEDNNLAKISILGPKSTWLNREVLTVQSPDGDYIDYSTITLTYDANNNKLFTDDVDQKWLMVEGGTTTNGLTYKLERLN